MNVTTIGIDLAKNSFSVCGADAHGKIRFKKCARFGTPIACLLPFP